jgi:hypothetical protein
MLTIQGILLLNDTAVLKQLANSMEQIPAWENNSLSDRQLFQIILLNS